MAENRTGPQEKVDLELLIQQFEELMNLCDHLQEENALLRSRQVRLQSEHTKLSGKNDLSRQKLETMISRLKSLEAEL